MERFWNSSVFKPQARISSEVRLLGWNVPPGDLRAIPDHWLSYPEPPASMHYLLGMIYLAFFIASMVGNGVVIWIFSSAKSLRTPSNVFVLNLAICDFLMMLKAPIFIFNSFNKGFALGPMGCQVFSFIGAVSGIAAAMSNALIANDRYNVIARPLEGKLSHRKAILLIFIVWAYTTPWAFLPVLEIWGRFVPVLDSVLSVCFFGRKSDVKFLGWNVPAEELHHIPEFWLTQVEPPMCMHYLLALMYIGFTFASIIGNGLVLWIFSGAKSLRTPSNLFVINLAFCDFIMMCKTPIFIYNSFKGGYALGHVACQIFAFIGSLSGIAGGMTNAAIGYDRYNVIAKPMDGKLSFTKAFLILFLIWFYTIPWAVLPLLEVWGRFVPEGYLTSCTFDYLTDNFDTRLFVGSIFTCSYVFPMSLIIYYYSQIVSQVFHHEKALREQAKKMNVESLRSNQDKNKSSAEVRIAKAAITICFLFVASWTPYGVMALIGAFGDKNLLTPGVTMIPACTCKLVACIDPYVYAISHPKYRMELQKRLPWLAITEKESDASSTNTTAESQTTAA